MVDFVALLHQGIAKAQRRGRDRHFRQVLQSLNLRHTAAAVGGLGEVEPAQAGGAAAFLAGSAMPHSLPALWTIAHVIHPWMHVTMPMDFCTKFFTWVFCTAAVTGAEFNGLLQIEGAARRPLTVSGKGELLWALALIFIIHIGGFSSVFFTWIFPPQRDLRLKHGCCFWGTSHACNMLHQGEQHQNEEHCHSRTQI